MSSQPSQQTQNQSANTATNQTQTGQTVGQQQSQATGQTTSNNLFNNQSLQNQQATQAGTGTTTGQTSGQTTSQNTPLTGPQGTLFNDVWNNAAAALNNNLSTPIPTDWLAAANPLQYGGVAGLANAAPSLGQNAPAIQGLTNQIASGYFSNPWNNPNFQGAVTAALTPGVQQLTENILPTISGNAMTPSGGPSAYGSPSAAGTPSNAITQQALQQWGNTAQNTGATMANNAYNTGLGLFNNIPALSGAGITSALAPGTTLGQAGTTLQGLQQNNLQNIIDRYLAGTSLPNQFLSQAGTIGATGGFGAQTGTTSQQAFQNMINQLTSGMTGATSQTGQQIGTGTTAQQAAGTNISNTASNLAGTTAGTGTGITTGTPPSMLTQILQGTTGGASTLASLFGSPAGGTSAVGGISNALSGVGSWLSGLGVPSAVSSALPAALFVA